MLENINNITSRMNQIEARLSQGPTVDSAGFQQFMGEAPPKQAPASANQLTPAQMLAMRSPTGGIDPRMLGATRPGTVDVQPQAQSNSISCGQTSVAMTINAMTGKNLRDTDVNNKYGFQLLDALKSETSSTGYTWKDGGEVKSSAWEMIDYKVNNEKTPVIVALNGPEFSPSGHGHIVTITKTEGDKVTFADPATGTIRTTTKQAMNAAPPHPQGNFIFYALKEDQGNTHVAAANP